MDTVVERLMRYARVYSESDPNSDSPNPSAEREFDMAHLLVEELHGLGLENAFVDEHCYVYAALDATPGQEHLPAIGLIAHMDTAPDMTGKDVKPQIIHYEGGDVVLNQEQNIVMKAADFPALANYVGQDLICSDGTTLLGADDKAGIAIILQTLEELLAENRPHGKLCIAFTPDEEIGRGTESFDVEGFGADFAYTVDGGEIHNYEYETFNAASADIRVHGFSIHPGDAKDRMKNALLMAMEFNSLLPALEIPAKTEGYEGFFHLDAMNGSVAGVTMEYIIRDHDMEKFTAKKALMEQVVAQVAANHPKAKVALRMSDSYYNMAGQLKDCMHLISNAQEAARMAGVEPKTQPIRGGTDGARLSFRGLPCPNLGTGGYNYHGPMEFVTVEGMDASVEILKNIVKLYAAL